MEFSEKLPILLRQAGLTQDELAGQLNVAQSQVSRWIGNNTPPSKWQVLLKMARLLSTTVDYLIDPSMENPGGLSEDERMVLKTVRDMELDSSYVNKLIKLGLQKEKQDAKPDLGAGLPATLPKRKLRK